MFFAGMNANGQRQGKHPGEGPNSEKYVHADFEGGESEGLNEISQEKLADISINCAAIWAKSKSEMRFFGCNMLLVGVTMDLQLQRLRGRNSGKIRTQALWLIAKLGSPLF